MTSGCYAVARELCSPRQRTLSGEDGQRSDVLVKINKGKPHLKWSQEALERGSHTGKTNRKNKDTKDCVYSILCVKFSSQLLVCVDKNVTFLLLQGGHFSHGNFISCF